MQWCVCYSVKVCVCVSEGGTKAVLIECKVDYRTFEFVGFKLGTAP